MAAPRPPSGITTHAFFSAWLPAEAARLGLLASGPEMHARVILDGEGGGAWDLRLRDGRIDVGVPGAGEAQVTMRQSVEDWRALLFSEDGGAGLAPAGAAPTDLLMIDPTSRQMLRTVRGAVEFRIANFRGRTWRLLAKLGEQPMPEQPDATITVDAETYAAMAARTLTPPEAYFGGKIVIGGDAGLAMQLGMAMLPRFGA
ncbi:MAG: SCP2 sterol-binding domain-containing protein [Myxococcota bacterium]